MEEIALYKSLIFIKLEFDYNTRLKMRLREANFCFDKIIFILLRQNIEVTIDIKIVSFR